jgi:hypothetical protein
MRHFLLATALLCTINTSVADTATKLATAIVDLDQTTLAAAPWLNQSHFVVVRTSDDPALKWIEKATGKSFAAELKTHPLLIYSGFEDATYFVSSTGDAKSILLDVASLKNRDPFSSGLSVSVAPLPKDSSKVFWINRIDESRERLGITSGSGFGSGKAPQKK